MKKEFVSKRTAELRKWLADARWKEERTGRKMSYEQLGIALETALDADGLSVRTLEMVLVMSEELDHLHGSKDILDDISAQLHVLRHKLPEDA